MKNHVRKYRRELDLTQQQLADMAETSRYTIISIEKGHVKEPSYSLMCRIAKALNRPVNEIFLPNGVAHVKQRAGTG